MPWRFIDRLSPTRAAVHISRLAGGRAGKLCNPPEPNIIGWRVVASSMLTSRGFDRLWLVTVARVLSLALVLATLWGAGMTSAAAAPPNKLAPRPVWGVCGFSSSQTKLVYDYPKMTLFCGYHDFDNDTGFGYLHIKAKRKTQFANLAAPTGLSWENLVHHALLWTDYAPDATRYNPGNDKVCRSRILYLANSNGLVVSAKVYKVIHLQSSGKILTIIAESAQCQNRDVGLSGAEPLSQESD